MTNTMPVLTDNEKADVLRYLNSLKNGILPGAGGEYQRHIEKLIAQIALASLEAEASVWIKPNSLGFPRMAEIEAVTIPFVPEYPVELYTAPPVPALKQIELPKSERLDGNGYGYYFDMNDVFDALDAAGANYKVKE